MNDFPSIQELAKYLKELMANADAYNKYHEWRAEYDVYMYDGKIKGYSLLCQICDSFAIKQWKGGENKKLDDFWLQKKCSL